MQKKGQYSREFLIKYFQATSEDKVIDVFGDYGYYMVRFAKDTPSQGLYYDCNYASWDYTKVINSYIAKIRKNKWNLVKTY